MSLVCPYANSGKNNSDFCKKSTYIAFFLNSLSVNQFNLQQQGNFFVLKLTRRLQVLVVHAHSMSEFFFKFPGKKWKCEIKSCPPLFLEQKLQKFVSNDSKQPAKWFSMKIWEGCSSNSSEYILVLLKIKFVKLIHFIFFVKPISRNFSWNRFHENFLPHCVRSRHLAWSFQG